jgi:hypothetical protein
MKAYELLADKKNWTRGANARDAHGFATGALGDDAVCWCIYGAITKCYADGNFSVYTEMVAIAVPKGLVSRFNDGSTHEEAIALLKSLDI